MSQSLADILTKPQLEQMMAEATTVAERNVAARKQKPVWLPLPGPQTMAYQSKADELFYGGAAGGGKTDLLLGIAATHHRQSIIFRRIFPSVRGIIERSREIFNSNQDSHLKDSYNESLHIWRLASGRLIEFGSMQYEHDKETYRGRPHDLYGWDEVTEFTETQFRFVNVWNRSTQPGQRSRVIATGNPPTGAQGEWIINYWAPWLDGQHPNPAIPGELRWFVRIDDKDVEIENGTPFDHKGEILIPRSRTFIPARLSDNPILSDTGYGGVLQGLPEPLRSQLLYGDFTIGMVDDPYQVIPTEWVRLAIERGKHSMPTTNEQTALGVDTAYGGRDKMVIAPRYGSWISPLIKYPGKDTPDGRSAATFIVAAIQGYPAINIDPIGYGAAAYEHIQDTASLDVRGINFGMASSGTDRSGRLRFANVRAEAYWRMRELLDPTAGSDVSLPDDRELLSDLTAAHWELRTGKIYLESKAEIKDRIGRSPDCGDAVVLAFYGSDPLALGTVARANEPQHSRFVKSNPTGGRWNRNSRTGYR